MIYNVAEEDVQRARNQLKASILFSQDGPSGAGAAFLHRLPASAASLCLPTGPTP